MDSHTSVSEHLTLCSPCFNAYMLHLSRVRAEAIQSHRTHRIIWIRRSILALGATAVLAIATSIFLARRHAGQKIAQRTPATEPTTPGQVSTTAAYTPVLINLSHTIPTRGSHPDNTAAPVQILLSSPNIELILQLPLGSEDRLYSVKLVAGGRVIWSDAAQAHLENGQAIIRMHVQLFGVAPGNYQLLADSEGLHFAKSLLVKASSGENKR